MLKVVILLFSIVVCINSAVVRTLNSEDQTLMEIINTLEHVTNGQISKPDCRSILVLDTFSDITHQGVSETFCKAAKALKSITPCLSIQQDLERLQVNLLKIGEMAVNCTLRTDSEIQLVAFLRNLMKFSMKAYRQ